MDVSLQSTTRDATSASHHGVVPAAQASACSSSPSPTKLSAIELRRKRNRESMQRARVRERAEIDKMRCELRVLEKQQCRLAAAVANYGQFDGSNYGSNPQHAMVLAQYYALSKESKHIKRENFLLQQTLERRRKSYERVERILADYHLEKTDVDRDDGDGDDAMVTNLASTFLTSASASSVFGFEPITEDQAFALITQCSASVRRLERAQQKQAAAPHNSMDLETRCFGWRVQRKVIGGSNLQFLFTKTYPNLDPALVACKAWDIYKTSDQNSMRSIRVLRFETLQVVNENTHVVAREILHPLHKRVVMRTIFLRFRMQTDAGFVVGRSCMNPHPGSPQRPSEMDESMGPMSSGIRYADITTWLEVNYVNPDDKTQVGCEVKLGGFVDYRTTDDLNNRFMNVLFSILRFENRVLEPLVSLLD
ncbi:hypothetical protein FI667_g9950, partial [Globisporangium splendens]